MYITPVMAKSLRQLNTVYTDINVVEKEGKFALSGQQTLETCL